MIWDFIVFLLGAACATGVCWWLWRSTDAERQALKDRIKRLEDDVSSRFKGS